MKQVRIALVALGVLLRLVIVVDHLHDVVKFALEAAVRHRLVALAIIFVVAGFFALLRQLLERIAIDSSLINFCCHCPLQGLELVLDLVIAQEVLSRVYLGLVFCAFLVPHVVVPLAFGHLVDGHHLLDRSVDFFERSKTVF